MQQRAANCKTENLDSKPTVSTVLEVTESQDQFSWSLQRVQSSQHDLISHLQCAKDLNGCIIVVITSSSNIHRTRRLGMYCVFASPLHDLAILYLTCSLLGACRVFVLVALSVLPGRRERKLKLVKGRYSPAKGGVES